MAASHARLDRVNALAVPFLDEEDTEDDYALLPPPKPLKSLQLMGIAFFAVSGSAYGIEETVAVGGPFLALLALLLAPVLWSAPMLMVASELSVAMPQSGGYIVWVNSAFGALPSMLNGCGATCSCNVLDCALYPVLLTDYLQRALPALRPSAAPVGAAAAADGAAAEAASLPLEMLWIVLRLALVALAAGLNVAGVNLVGHAAGAFHAARQPALRRAHAQRSRVGRLRAGDAARQLGRAVAAGRGGLVLPRHPRALEHVRLRLGGHARRRGRRAARHLPARAVGRARAHDVPVRRAARRVRRPPPLAGTSGARASSRASRPTWAAAALALLVEAGAVLSLVAVLCTLMCTTSRAPRRDGAAAHAPGAPRAAPPDAGHPRRRRWWPTRSWWASSPRSSASISSWSSPCAPTPLQPEPEPDGLLEPQP